MNYYETPTGLKFVLNTDLNVAGNPRDLLHQLYEQVVISYVTRSPTGTLNQPIKNPLFETKLDEFFRSSIIF
jgi:hypothetical protein